eukprot:gnl/TRDRNA2_/TRDRNA2_36046_c0_seq1.p1 gnl/TRDRNA2_/TRDRNA2_36046_c0~~gnl/TRDRNA2_/TRDRNA2_36046_c0_seq1.p1  ORF type:complete len:277 (-),score=103.64 gnl/TRDRNA2_/TRDRNA2_36046_c0_seq1:101-931(-)
MPNSDDEEETKVDEEAEEAADFGKKKKKDRMGKKGKKAAASKAEKEEEDDEAAKADEDEEEGDTAKAEDKKAEEKKDEGSEAPKEFPKVGYPFVPHDQMPAMVTAVEVTYCPIDGLPPDFCQYGPSWEKSRPWCLENFPQYYPELAGMSLADAKNVAEGVVEKSKVKELPGGKKKREVSPHVTIKRLARGGRKCVTSVIGLEGFGVKLEDAAKRFKKKFACGSAVVKGDAGIPDCVEIQGDFEEEVTELIVEEWTQVPREKIASMDGGTKKGGKKK